MAFASGRHQGHQRTQLCLFDERRTQETCVSRWRLKWKTHLHLCKLFPSNQVPDFVRNIGRVYGSELRADNVKLERFFQPDEQVLFQPSEQVHQKVLNEKRFIHHQQSFVGRKLEPNFQYCAERVNFLRRGSDSNRRASLESTQGS